jgi:hypothetical protein
VGGDIIAEQDRKVGSKRIGGVDHAGDVLDRHIRTAGMNIGDRRHRETPGVPPRRGDAIRGRDQPLRFDRGRIDRGAESGENGPHRRHAGEIRDGSAAGGMRPF